MQFWGGYADENYGLDRAGRPASLVENTYIRWYWSGGLELIALALERLAHRPPESSRDGAFVRDTLLRLARPILWFFARHWPRDEGGKIRFEPAASLETWHEAVNPLPEIAGIAT